MVKHRQIIYEYYPRNPRIPQFVLQTVNNDGTKRFGVQEHTITDGYSKIRYREEIWKNFITIVRHDLGHDTVKFFDSFDIQKFFKDGVEPVDMYCISDDLIVLVLLKDFCLIQHLIKLVPPGSVVRYSFDYDILKRPKVVKAHRGEASTVCTRRITMENVYGIRIGMSLLHSGQVVVCGSSDTDYSSMQRRLTVVIVISANPLSIDEYPDDVLIPHVEHLADFIFHTEDHPCLALMPPIFYDGVIFFWLQIELEREDPDYGRVVLDTSAFGTLYRDEKWNNEYRVGKWGFPNAETKHPVFMDKMPTVVCSRGDFFFLVYRAASDDHFKWHDRLGRICKKLKFALAQKVNACFHYFDWEEPFESCGCWRRLPEVYLVFSINFSGRSFTLMPYKVRQLGLMNRNLSVTDATRELLIVSLLQSRANQVTATFKDKAKRNRSKKSAGKKDRRRKSLEAPKE